MAALNVKAKPLSYVKCKLPKQLFLKKAETGNRNFFMIR